jgi:hypothetical protein
MGHTISIKKEDYSFFKQRQIEKKCNKGMKWKKEERGMQ